MKATSSFISLLSLFAATLVPFSAPAFASEVLIAQGLPTLPSSMAQNVRRGGSGIKRIGVRFTKFTSPDGAFTAKVSGMCPVERQGAFCGFPAPQPMYKQVQGDGFTVDTLTFNGGAWEVGFNLNVLKFPFNSDPSVVLPNHLQLAKARLIDREGGRLVKERMITFQGYPGYDLVVTNGTFRGGYGYTTITRCVIVGNRQYIWNVSVFDGTLKEFSGDIKEFMEGVRILKRTSR